MSKTAFLFPGQGAQTVGMGRQLANALPPARELYDVAGEVLGYDLAKLCFEGPKDQLDSTQYSQPALYVTSLAALENLRTDSPDLVDSVSTVAGLSLGEYTALVFAGVLDFADGLRLVQKRGEAMQQAADESPSGMVSVVGLLPDQILQLCEKARDDEILEPANYLCPGNIVVSGSQSACQRAADLAVEMGAIKSIPLEVAGAFHTQIMESAVVRLSEALESVELKPARIPVISNVDARPHQDAEEIRSLLVQQVVAPVRWEESMRYLLENNIDEFYEVGPGRVLRGLLRRIERKVSCRNVAA